MIVPQVPKAAKTWVTAPAVWRQISGPVVRSWARAFCSFSYWLGMA